MSFFGFLFQLVFEVFCVMFKGVFGTFLYKINMSVWDAFVQNQHEYVGLGHFCTKST